MLRRSSVTFQPRQDARVDNGQDINCVWIMNSISDEVTCHINNTVHMSGCVLLGIL